VQYAVGSGSSLPIGDNFFFLTDVLSVFFLSSFFVGYTSFRFVRAGIDLILVGL
jgi:hypothetical protein